MLKCRTSLCFVFSFGCTLDLSILPLSRSLSGKPESYAEYFSLNRTTAELLLLKPIYRELHSRFDLVIKVRHIRTGNLLWTTPESRVSVVVKHF